jgi:undecaprenyl-diphosphatase
MDPELRKSFEVALHAGAAAALAIVLRCEVRPSARDALSLAPAAAAGLALERPVERRLGGARSVAACQVIAGLALWAADRAPEQRRTAAATPLDHFLIGLGQAAALAPGVSRNGATLTVARLRRFHRADASRLSRRAALPVILGAAALKGFRLARRGLPEGARAGFAAGAAAAFCSTLASAPLLGAVDRARSYGPFAAYRVALGTAALVAARRPSAAACLTLPG